jgi:predicted permease
MISVLRDVSFAFRLFWRNPFVTAIALLSIALSVGATAVVFTAVHSVLLAPLPYTRPSELVQIRMEFPRFGLSHADWMFWKDAQEIARRSRTLASVGIYRNELLDLAGDASSPPEALYGLRVSANLFPLLGVTPMFGRNILPDEDQPGHADEMILSYGLWTRRFNADPRIVGRNLLINGRNCLVIGVMPRDFDFPLRRAAVHTPSPYVEFWAPMRAGKPVAPTEGLGSVARLKTGVSLLYAQQDLATISDDLAREFPATNRDHVLRLGLLRDRLLGQAKSTLWILMTASGMFLLIGCVNVANLLLARGLSRQREIALRMAIGAPRGRIFRQVLTEGCSLGALGGLAGYLLTVAAWKTLPVIAPRSIPRLATAHAGWTVLAFALVIALANSILFAMIPAYRAGWRTASAAAGLRSQVGTGGRRDWARGTLVAIEVALAVALVVVGGQILAGFVTLIRTDPGFEANRILASVVIPNPARYATPEQYAALYRRILDSVASLPGVQLAGTVNALPFSGENDGGLISQSQAGALGVRDQVAAEIDVVSAGYLQAMGVRLLGGRWFTTDDMSDSSDVAIVNDNAAQRLWPGRSAIGRRMCVDCSAEKPNNWKRVIGVVSSIRHATLEGPQGQSVYLAAGALKSAVFLVVRSDRPGVDLQKSIRKAIAAIDPNQPVFLSTTMQTFIDDSIADRRFLTFLLAFTGCLALAMAAGGVYGVAMYASSRRTREIGIRMALGATRGNVEALVFRQGFVSAIVGLAAGVALSIAAMRILRAAIPGLQSGRQGQIVLEIGIVMLAAALACWLPARRATKADPMLALRQD